MQLKNIIKTDNCHFISATTKTESIIELIDKLSSNNKIKDPEILKKEIFYREQLMSTGLGLGIGIPHVRLKNHKDPIIGIGICKDGISDYHSIIDDEKVKILVLIILGENDQKLHIRLLSQITTILKEKENREILINSTNSEDIFNLFMEK